MKKRIIAFLLTMTMLLSAFNTGMVVFSVETNTDVAITVLDSNGENIDDEKIGNSALSVSVTCAYRRNYYGSIRTENRPVTNFGDGVFGYNYSKRDYIQYYTVNVTLRVDGITYTASEQVAKNADSVVITLDDYVQSDKWETFDVYYIADGQFPNSFYGYGDSGDYGPSRDDTPLLSINVNITKLRSAEFSNAVLYQQNFINTDPETYDKNIGNAYHFIPAQISDNKDKEKAYVENVGYANAFWTAVKKCMDDESLKAFEATGLFNNYIVYCLKNQGTASNPDNHADGILVADITDEEIRPIEPPVYVVEMYDHNGHIFHGYTDDLSSITANPVSVEDVLSDYADLLNIENEWTKVENDVWENSYIKEIDGRKYLHNLQVTQKDVASPPGHISSGKIKYERKTNTYYVATFNATLENEPAEHILTYTDGVADDIFDQEVYPLETGAKAVAFKGSTNRENYNFIGWTLEGGDGTVLSQDEILKKYTSVNSDLTFVAVYTVAPTKYHGTVEVILDGYYNTSNATATGKRIDITTVKGDNVSLYVKADNTDYIKLERTATATGVYSAQLLNGDYKIYYYDGENYILSSDQHLSINSEDRTRYIFFECVEYNLNGGIGGPEPTLEYYDSGVAVKVSDKVPTKQGYIFDGWMDQDGTKHQAGSVLSNAIDKSYTLTAQWVDAADVYVNVTIDHDGGSLGHDTTSVKDDISLELVFTPDISIPYIETGHKIDINNENHPNHEYTYTPNPSDEESILETVYTAKTPSVTDVSKAYLYSVTVSKHNYEVTSVGTKPDENGDIIINVELKYAPDNEDLTFEVRVDTGVPTELMPQAAIVKVLAWSSENNRWEIIVQHKNTDTERKPGVRVDIDANTRTGTGSYPVWVSDGSQNPYGYRIIVTALIYPDGTIVETDWASSTTLEQFKTHPYTVEIGKVSDGELYGGLKGAYFENDVQKGKLDAFITAKYYTVTFDANGGKVNGKDKDFANNQYKVPEFDAYVATRDGGYVFDGWYLESDCKTPATEGVDLNDNIILYAKWKEPLTIEGMITVGATYVQENEDGTVTIQKIPEREWVKSLIVLLQKVEPNGYTDTINQQFVSLDYNYGEYYHEGRVVGYTTYSFTGIPDLGDTNNYRVQVLINNYTATFQNETEDASVLYSKNYPKYTDDQFYAVFGKIDPKTATVNVHAHFSPQEFKLEYSVNAEQIGDDFKPQQAEVLITSDSLNSGRWDVISQMVFDDKYVGDDVDIIDGKGQGTDMVWIGRADGVTNYQYALRVDEVLLADGITRVKFTDALPFTVEYQGPAHYMDGAQVGKLVATFVPKTYNVIYDTNGGSLSGNYPTKHTWSFETSIAGIVPVFSGFKFAGWYLDEEFTQPAGDYIGADVATDTTLYAKWIQVMDTVDLVVTINHESQDDGGLASNFNKKLYAQLTYAERNVPHNEQVYVEMSGYSKEYPNGQWHTHGNNVKIDTFEVPSFYTHLSSEYDYSVDVKLEHYYVVDKTVVKELRPDGSTLHTVNVILQFVPDLFDLNFYVKMAENDMPDSVYPQSVDVKVTAWYDDPDIDTTWDWYRITQHKASTVTVEINSETGYGEGKCSVWHWYDEENKIPYYYRIEIISLNFANGNTVAMNEKVADVSYSGGGYNGEIIVEGGSVPDITVNQNKTTLEGVYATATQSGDSHVQVGTLGAVISVNKVIFHSKPLDGDIFRTYYPAVSASSNGEHYSLNQDGTISAFYEIPEFDYLTHNKYVFKGWYLEDGSTPVKWSDVYDETTHIYAHWIETGSVEQEKEDNKNFGDSTYTYAGFDLVGVQIRDGAVDTIPHYGEVGSGLRFITVLSEKLYGEINAISGKEAEYGFVLARSSTADGYADGDQNYTLQLKGENINGVDTTSTHSYVQNFKCSGVKDHYNSENYRLYTVVITYKNHTGEELEKAYNVDYSARSYIKYVDANGLERVYYNNYTGRKESYGGCRTSFAYVKNMMTK